MTTLDFPLRKKNNQKISMITCYDSTFAKLVSNSDIDCILIGDSCSMKALFRHGIDRFIT